MAYSKKTWATSDPITAADLNHLENGVAVLACGTSACNLTTAYADFSVSFGKTFASAPVVVANPYNAGSGYDVNWGVHTITTTGFKIRAKRGSALSVTFGWIAYL